MGWRRRTLQEPALDEHLQGGRHLLGAVPKKPRDSFAGEERPRVPKQENQQVQIAWMAHDPGLFEKLLNPRHHQNSQDFGPEKEELHNHQLIINAEGLIINAEALTMDWRF
jgi:hypothetical protein